MTAFMQRENARLDALLAYQRECYGDPASERPVRVLIGVPAYCEAVALGVAEDGRVRVRFADGVERWVERECVVEVGT